MTDFVTDVSSADPTKPMQVSKTAIIIEDDAMARLNFGLYCEMAGLTVIGSAGDADAAEELILRNKPDFVLMDVRLETERDGVEVAMAVHTGTPETKVIFVTGSSEEKNIARILMDHPHDILIKPIAPDDIMRATAA